MKKACKVATAGLLVGAMVAGGAGAAYAATASSFWTGSDVSAASGAVTVDSNLLKTYGVRAGSAGGDFLGISNTNFDFTQGKASQSTQFTADPSNAKITTSDFAKYVQGYRGAGLAIWASAVNESPNPYYWNLYYSMATGTTSATSATTWMSNPSTSAWGDSNGVTNTSTNTIAGMEYSPDIIFGANKYTSWQNLSLTGTNYGKAVEADANYNPVVANNDATNIWSQVYTVEQLAAAADKLTANSSKTTRYDNSSASDSAIAYEKAIRGNMLYIASQLDNGAAKHKVAYLYAVDEENGTAYFFTPEADGLLEGDSADAWNEEIGDSKDTAAPTEEMTGTAYTNYAANNGTIGLGYMATLPFITDTFTEGTATQIAMKVEDIWKYNPAVSVSTTDLGSALDKAGVDTIIYNTNTSLTANGTSGGKNGSGVKNTGTYASGITTANLTALLGSAADGMNIIAGDDYGTSTNQPKQGTAAMTAKGQAPLLYCQRNYTMDKNARAAWAFSQVYPELYDGNADASYAYWVAEVYHVKAEYVPAVTKYLINKRGNVVYNTLTMLTMEGNFQDGYDWWTNTGSKKSEWNQYAYYNGSTRASYYNAEAVKAGRAGSVTTDSTEAKDTIGIFTPSATWTADVNENNKDVQSIKVAKASVTVKAKAVKKAKKAYSFKVSGAKTSLTATLTKAAKKAGFKVKTTKTKVTVTVPKGAKKGTYKVTVMAKASSKYFASASKTITIKVK